MRKEKKRGEEGGWDEEMRKEKGEREKTSIAGSVEGEEVGIVSSTIFIHSFFFKDFATKTNSSFYLAISSQRVWCFFFILNFKN